MASSSSSSGASHSDASRLLPRHSTVLANVQQARAAWWSRRDAATAAPLYMRIVQQVSDLLPELEVELAESLGAYANTLLLQEGATSTRQALWLLDNATRSLPTSKLLAYEQGCLCFRARHYLPALDAFRRALQIDPGYLAALDAMENLKNLAVDRWHFRMLNDKVRNITYQQALRRVLAEEMTRLGHAARVLDIGTGTGLLAWMALEDGAGEVVACETNPVLCAVASALLPTQHGRVQILNQMSYDVQLAIPVDVVVTELVDSGLLGEHILPVLRHARQQLLRPGGRIIPHAATVHAVVIESAEIRRRARLLMVDKTGTTWWAGLKAGGVGFEGGGSSAKVDGGMGSNDDNNSDTDAFPNITVDENYTCDSLAVLPHRRLTQAVAVMEIPLSDPPPRAEDEPDASLTAEIDLEVMSDGEADAVAMWFDLDLLLPEHGLEKCSFSTGPGREGNGWDQGIYFLPAGHLLRRGESCRLRVAVVQDQLTFKLMDSTNMDVILPSSFPSSFSSARIKVGEMDMAHLNDTGHIDAYRQALTQIAAAALAEGQQPITTVVEWSGSYSVLGLVAAGVPALQSVPLTIVTGNEESAAALRTWGRARLSSQQEAGISSRSVHVMSSNDDQASSALVGLLPQALLLPSDQSASCPSASRQQQHLLVIHDLVESSGWLRQGALNEARLLQSVFMSKTATTTITTTVLPAAISVFIQGLEAPTLLRQNRLEPDNLLGFPAEQVLDGLGVRKFRDLDLGNKEEYRPVTASAVAFRVDVGRVVGASRRRDASGEAEEDNEEEIVARARVDLPVTANVPGAILHAVGFWFQLHLTEPGGDEKMESDGDGGVSFNTGPPGPGEENTSYRQGAVLVGPMQVVAGQRVQMEMVWSVSRGIDLVVLGVV